MCRDRLGAVNENQIKYDFGKEIAMKETIGHHRKHLIKKMIKEKSMKLDPRKLGLLAGHVRKALLEHPEPKVSPKSKFFPVMNDWEVALKKAIDDDPELPSYEDLGNNNNSELEFLIEYYIPEEEGEEE